MYVADSVVQAKSEESIAFHTVFIESYCHGACDYAQRMGVLHVLLWWINWSPREFRPPCLSNPKTRSPAKLLC